MGSRPFSLAYHLVSEKSIKELLKPLLCLIWCTKRRGLVNHQKWAYRHRLKTTVYGNSGLLNLMTKTSSAMKTNPCDSLNCIKSFYLKIWVLPARNELHLPLGYDLLHHHRLQCDDWCHSIWRRVFASDAQSRNARRCLCQRLQLETTFSDFVKPFCNLDVHKEQ